MGHILDENQNLRVLLFVIVKHPNSTSEKSVNISYNFLAKLQLATSIPALLITSAVPAGYGILAPSQSEPLAKWSLYLLS